MQGSISTGTETNLSHADSSTQQQAINIGYNHKAPPQNTSRSTTSPDTVMNQNTQKRDFPTCPYHGPILDMVRSYPYRNMSPMERFYAEGPTEQYSVSIRSDTRKLSTYRRCTCHTSMRGRSPERM